MKKHDPEKLALGLDPRVEAGFPKRSCSMKKHDPEKWKPVFRAAGEGWWSRGELNP
jgi:hypothetical protein